MTSPDAAAAAAAEMAETREARRIKYSSRLNRVRISVSVRARPPSAVALIKAETLKSTAERAGASVRPSVRPAVGP